MLYEFLRNRSGARCFTQSSWVYTVRRYFLLSSPYEISFGMGMKEGCLVDSYSSVEDSTSDPPTTELTRAGFDFGAWKATAGAARAARTTAARLRPNIVVVLTDGA